MTVKSNIEVRFARDIVWLSQKKMFNLFEKHSDTNGLHLKNIFFEEELEAATITGRLHGELKVWFPISSVGKPTFKGILEQDYAINEKQLSQKQQQVRTLKEGICILSRAFITKIGDPYI